MNPVLRSEVSRRARRFRLPRVVEGIRSVPGRKLGFFVEMRPARDEARAMGPGLTIAVVRLVASAGIAETSGEDRRGTRTWHSFSAGILDGPRQVLALSWFPGAYPRRFRSTTWQGGVVHLKGVGPDNSIVYENDWYFDVFDNNYLRAQTSLGEARLRGNIVSRDMWD